MPYNPYADRARFSGVFPTIQELDRYRNLRLGLPVPLSSTPPWGYEMNKELGRLEPIDEQMALLVYAKQHLKTSAYTELARWISAESGRRIGESSFRSIITNRLPFDEAALPREERNKFWYSSLSMEDDRKDIHSYVQAKEKKERHTS